MFPSLEIVCFLVIVHHFNTSLSSSPSLGRLSKDNAFGSCSQLHGLSGTLACMRSFRVAQAVIAGGMNSLFGTHDCDPCWLPASLGFLCDTTARDDSVHPGGETATAVAAAAAATVNSDALRNTSSTNGSSLNSAGPGVLGDKGKGTAAASSHEASVRAWLRMCSFGPDVRLLCRRLLEEHMAAADHQEERREGGGYACVTLWTYFCK